MCIRDRLFGAPDPETSLSVLPGHRFLLSGSGYEALFLTVLGGVGVTILTILTFPLLLYLIPMIYNTFRFSIHLLLLSIAVWMIITEKGKAKYYAVFVFLLSGILGTILLNTLPENKVLFPALTGLFGLSSLFISMINKTKLPPQSSSIKPQRKYLKALLTGWFAGLVSGMLPGAGVSQSAIIGAQMFRAKTRDFLIAMGGINTANILFTFIMFYTLGKTRSGAVAALSEMGIEINPHDIPLIIITVLISCCISSIITLKTGRYMLLSMKTMEYQKINALMILILLILVFVLSNWIGIVISVTSMCLGMLCILTGTRRTHLMGFLVLPTIFYFSDMNFIILSTL